ncbi:MAG: contact-dependent growth inhibition system immunity protein [Thermoguttaceae bacterium]
MAPDFDRRKTLTELEGQDWGPPNFDSHLVTTIHQLRHKPLEQFTVADLQMFIGQNMSLEFLLPIAIEHLQDDPLVEGDYYQGDLLVAVLRIQSTFWSNHPELWRIVCHIAVQADARRAELTAIEKEALDQGLATFRLPKFSPLQKVIVTEQLPPKPGEGGIIGEHGVIIWRSPWFVERNRFGTSGWLYIVYFPQSKTYDGVEESRLASTDEVVELESCLGQECEISYDPDGAGPNAISGSFRTPGKFWDTFVFHNEAVEELTCQVTVPVRSPSGGIARHDFAVPEGILLDCEYIEETMCRQFAAKQWRRIRGPQSNWFN